MIPVNEFRVNSSKSMCPVRLKDLGNPGHDFSDCGNIKYVLGVSALGSRYFTMFDDYYLAPLEHHIVFSRALSMTRASELLD